MDAILTLADPRDTVRGELLLRRAGIPARAIPPSEPIQAGNELCLHIPCSERVRAAGLLAQGGVEVEGCFLVENNRPFPMPEFTQALGICRGDVVSIVGCGGKTALLHRLAMENRDCPVLLSTTTHIRRPPDEVLDSDTMHKPLPPGVHLYCKTVGEKLSSVDPGVLADAMPDDGIVLLEADGSRGLPLKGWTEYEPVIHERTTMTVGVCTVWPVGHIHGVDLVHRPERYYPLAGAVPGERVTPAHIAAMAGAPGGMFEKAKGRRALLINQVETPEAQALAGELADLLAPSVGTVLMGSVWGGTVKVLKGA